MPKQFASWTEVVDQFRARGVTTLFVKRLAKQQDNEKNQIVLGSSLEQIGNLLPVTLGERGVSRSRKKRSSRPGAAVLEGRVPWTWIDREDRDQPAPATRVIFYFQYPEVRLSGFLKGCRGAPDAVRRKRQAAFGERALVFGTGGDGLVYAIVVTKKEDPRLFPVAGLQRHAKNKLLYVIDTAVGAIQRLLKLLKAIQAHGWVHSQRLKTPGAPPLPFRGTQGAGYTLESLLGIPSNPSKVPDWHGVEVKSYSQKKISLMTPTPDGGIQGTQGLLRFLEKFGRPGKKDPGRRVFNGMHIVGVKHKKTGLLLSVSGYDSKLGFSGKESDVEVALVEPATGVKAAAWSYLKLFESWNKKHAKAVYVSAKKRVRSPSSRDLVYAFADTVWVCEGTTSKKLLDAMLKGQVAYDPGDTSKSKQSGKPKPRPQWRLRDIKNLSSLYDQVREVHFP